MNDVNVFGGVRTDFRPTHPISFSLLGMIHQSHTTNHYRVTLVEQRGLEPRTPCLQSRCSSQLSYCPKRDVNFIYFTVELPKYQGVISF